MQAEPFFDAEVAPFKLLAHGRGALEDLTSDDGESSDNERY